MVDLTMEDFSTYIGAIFELDSQPVRIEIRLDKLTPLQNGPAFLTRAPFSLGWSTEPNVAVTAGLYWLRRRDWGPHQVYIEAQVPLPQQRRTYHSTFF